MPKFRKKPVEIEAVQLTWQTWNEVCEFVGEGAFDEGFVGGWFDPGDGRFHAGDKPPAHLSIDDLEIAATIPTLEGDHLARQGDWIIRGVQGELYPCKPDIFEQTYEPADGRLREEVLQDAVDTAYSALSGSQYVGGLSEREAFRQAQAALGLVATQHVAQGAA